LYVGRALTLTVLALCPAVGARAGDYDDVRQMGRALRERVAERDRVGQDDLPAGRDVDRPGEHARCGQAAVAAIVVVRGMSEDRVDVVADRDLRRIGITRVADGDL